MLRVRSHVTCRTLATQRAAHTRCHVAAPGCPSTHPPEPQCQAATADDAAVTVTSSFMDSAQDVAAESARRLPRRALLSSLAAVAAAGAMRSSPSLAQASEDRSSLLYVTQSESEGVPEGAQVFRSLSAAIQAAQPGARILVAAGSYNEKLSIDKPLVIEAYPQGARVQVVWETQVPYEHAIECSYDGPQEGPVLRGLQVRHYSKSVANNYGVFITRGSPVFEGCDISSSSGTGVGIEGARRPLFQSCRIHGCASHGLAVYGAISDDFEAMPLGTEACLRDCEVVGNKLNGVLVRTGGSADVERCIITDNSSYGINIQDAGGRFVDNTVQRNGMGAFMVVPSFDFDLDLSALKATNKLLGAVLMK